MILELSMPLRGSQALVRLMDIHIPNENDLTFVYRVFLTDPEDDMDYELTTLQPHEHEQVWRAVNQELQELCS